MRHQSKTKQSSLLDFLSQTITREAKFAALTLQSVKLNVTSEMSILLLEYLQLVSQILLLTTNLWSAVPSEDSFSGFIVSVLKLLNPGSLFILTGRNEIAIGLIIISIIIIVYKYMNFLYILYTIVFKADCPYMLARSWKILFQIQGRTLYSLLSSIWVSTAIITLQDGFTFLRFGKVGTLVLVVGLLIVEFIFCLGLRLRYYTILPNQSLLSSKASTIEVITLSQKFILQILQIIFSSISYIDDWIIPSINIILSIIQNIVYFKTLPLYNIKGLQYQGIMFMIIASLNIACFFQKIIDPQDSLYFILIVWIWLSILLAKMCEGYIDKQVVHLALSRTRNLSAGLIQKINIIKQLLSKLQDQNSSRYYAHLGLVNSAIIQTLTNSPNLLEAKQNMLEPNADGSYPKRLIFKILINYLESAQSAHPKDDLLKLYIAKLSAKKLKSYGPALTSVLKFQHSTDHILAINATLLMLSFQEQIKVKSAEKRSQVNLNEYIWFQTQYIESQIKIFKQTNLQMDLYQEMMKESPDLSQIFNQGQHIEVWRQKIENEINLMMKNIPDYYTSPVLTYAYYYLLLNHSSADYSKYLKIYSYRKVKYTKSFENENIVAENSYQESNAMVLVSGQKESFGKIVFYTESLEKIYGGDTSSYLGADVSVIAPLDCPSFGSLFDAITGNGFKGYCHHRAGYMIKLEFYIDVFPVLTNGFYYCILVRPISKEKIALETLQGRKTWHEVEKLPSKVSTSLNINQNVNELIRQNKANNDSNCENTKFENYYMENINSTRWEPKEIHKEKTRLGKDIDENNVLERLTSQRTESALLSRYSDRKFERLREPHMENHNKKIVDDESWNKLLTNADQERTSQALNSSLTKKYYFKPLRMAYIAFYALLLAIILAQVILKTGIDSTIDDLRTKKEILIKSQTRDISFVNIARAGSFVVDQITGVFNVTSMNSLGITMKTFLGNINTNMVTLNSANQNIETNAGLLTESLRETLFKEDIRLYFNTIYGNETTAKMTNFEATDHLTQVILKTLVASKTNLTQTASLLQFVMQNSLNDLFVKTESTTELFTESIESNAKEKQIAIKVTFILFSVLLGVMSLSLLKVILVIYQRQRLNMLALIKLDPSAINKLHSRLDMFTNLLETGCFSENKDTLHSLRISVIAEFQRKFRNRTNFHSIKSGGLIRKYFFFFVRYLLGNALIIGLIAWSSFSASNSIESLHTEQIRMVFANDAAKMNVVAYVAFRLLYGTIDTAKIRNQLVGVQLIKEINNFANIRAQAMSMFQDEDGNYDLLIGKLLFDHQCKDLIVVATAADTCGYLSKQQKKLGLITLLSDYEGLLRQMNESYYSSDKTVATLQALQAQNFDMLLSTHRVTLDESTTIANRTNVIFEQKFVQAKDTSRLILIILLILLPLLAYLIWIFTFRQLRESDNKFKSLLKNYPANLVLSNFLLKAYLLKTSTGVLDLIKSY